MRTSKDVGKAHDKHHNSNSCNCGEAVFRRLPTVVCETMTCLCPRDYRAYLTRMSELGIPGIGSFCNLCGKPERFTIAYYLFNCEGCGKLFTFNFAELPPQEGIWPPPNILCKDCDVPPPTRRSRISFD